MILTIFALIFVATAQLWVQDDIIDRISIYDIVYQTSIARIYDNMIEPRGTLLASPSKQSPDYYYHWVRDASIVYNTMLGINNSLGLDLAEITKQHQKYNLGEPKFYTNGIVFDKPWGRPQNDGPALRIITLTNYIKRHLQNGGNQSDLDWLYQAEMPAKSIMKRDLEFVAKVWDEKCFDLWEEQFAKHYYTQTVQMAALTAGNYIANLFGDHKAALYYINQRNLISVSLDKYWNTRGFVKAMIEGGDPNRLDVSIILACLHTKQFEKDVCTDEKTLGTLPRLISSFEFEYPINYNTDIPLVGRYANDLYNGTAIDIGNPWILATFTVAEYFYTLADQFNENGSVSITKTSLPFFIKFFPDLGLEVGKIDDTNFKTLLKLIKNLGDAYMDRVLYVIQDNFSEQLHRDTGERVGASDLTWSYASFVSAFHARQKL